VLVVVVIVVVIHFVVVAATPFHFFKIFAALARLSAALAVAVHGVAQLILRLVNTLLTFFVSLVSVVRPCWEGRAHQADRQQCKAKNSNYTGYLFSLMNRNLSWSAQGRRCDNYSSEGSPWGSARARSWAEAVEVRERRGDDVGPTSYYDENAGNLKSDSRRCFLG
jgi:hypothetical protein